MPAGGKGVSIGVWVVFYVPTPQKKKVSPVGVVGAESASAPSPRVAQGLPVVLWALFLWSYKRSALRCNGAFWA